VHPREVVEKFPNLRVSIVEKLLQTFGDIKSGKVFRGALWIVGEYCADPAGMLAGSSALRDPELIHPNQIFKMRSNRYGKSSEKYPF
jgi:hypothetical protein